MRRWVWPGWEVRRRALRWEVRVLAGVALISVGGSYLVPLELDRTDRGYLVLAQGAMLVRVFLFHMGLVLVAMGVIAGALRWWREAVVCLVTGLGLCGGEYVRSGAVDGGVLPAKGKPVAPFSVMTANIIVDTKDFAPLLAEVERVDPDVLCLQEFTFETERALSAPLALRYPYRVAMARDHAFGIGLFSKLPLVGEGENLPGPGMEEMPMIRAVVEAAAGREVAVYTVHLPPPLGLAEMRENHEQLARLLGALQGEELPCVVVGDFNFTGRSPQTVAMKRLGLTEDAWGAVGRGRGATWCDQGVLRWVPGLRLDHVYLRGGLQALQMEVGPSVGSDHRPVWVRVAL